MIGTARLARYAPYEPMAATPREERLAENEALFRTANERMAEWEEQHVQSETELYYCECADPNCREKVLLRKADYEKVRADSRQFVIVPGHEVPDIETVIEQHEGWAMVEKSPELDEKLERLDPRTDS
jgi:hypothetical protein